MDVPKLLQVVVVFYCMLYIESANISLAAYSSGVLESSAVIRCTYNHLPGEIFTGLTWQQGPTLTNPNYVAYFRGNGSLTTNVKTKQPITFTASVQSRSSLIVTMTINQIGCDKEGNFRCLVTFKNVNNSETIISSDTKLRVKDYPDAPYIDVNKGIIREFDEITFTCEAIVGRPAGSIVWNIFREGSSVPIIKSSTKKASNSEGCNNRKVEELTMIVTREDHLATVGCKIEQELIEDDTEFTAVYGPLPVLYAPSTPIIYKSPNTEKISLGEEYVLTCISSGNPEPRITWYKNGVSVKFGKKYTIRNVTKVDEGLYECVARNEVNTEVTTQNNSFSLSVIDDSILVSVAESQTSGELPSITVALVTSAIWIAVFVIAVIVYKCVLRHKKEMKNTFSRLSSKFSVRRREDPSVAFERNYQGLSIKERKGRDSATYASAIFEDATYLDIMSDEANMKKSIKGRSSGIYDSSFIPKRALPPKPVQNDYSYAEDGYLDLKTKY